MKGLTININKMTAVSNGRYGYTNITTATTTTVAKGAGVLHAIVINATAASTITVYDSTSGSGQKIATIAASPVIGQVFLYDAVFANGCTIVTAGSPDITVMVG